MSWLFSQALVVEYLGENFSDGEQCAPLSGKPIPQAYCAPDKMTAFSKLSRFGMTYAPLTGNLGEELLTLYLAAFHAPTFPQQEKAQESMESSQECGEKWRGSFTKYNPNSCSWKTHQCSLLGDLDEFLETWPRWGLMRGGECWEQQTLVQSTKGIESGLSLNSPPPPDNWPTPATKGYGHAAEGMVGNLIEKIQQGVITKLEAEQMLSLPHLENHRTWKKKFPTPQASDHRDRGNMSNAVVQRRIAIGKQISLSQSVSLTSGQLNPMWVEWLMGFPRDWTNLSALVMPKSHCVPQQHGKYSVKESND